MNRRSGYLFACLLSLFSFLQAQNEAKQWYFGNYAGLDFNTSPPTVLNLSASYALEGCASIADASGSLLFYTNGVNVYTQAHTIMANGSNLMGNPSSNQAALIVKQPGNSNLYYIFNQGGPIFGTSYSIVDMSLAAGLGSVTVRNATLMANTAEALTAVRHCNGIDIWVLIHSDAGNTFHAFLLTASGVNTTPITTNIGINYVWTDYRSSLKFSPNGKKVANALTQSYYFQIIDFDAGTGVLSNAAVLGPTLNLPYSVEFSSDGTKLYGTKENYYEIFQWDLCAGSATAIAASMYTVCNTGLPKNTLQLAPDGKIYVSAFAQGSLGVIGNPNAAGAACNYTDAALSVSPKACNLGLPNFMVSSLKMQNPTQAFTFTVSNMLGCLAAGFTLPPTVNSFSYVGCASSAYSLTGYYWDFGDPASGSANTSTQPNPVHSYINLGTYTAKLILQYSCGGGTDTVKQVINITQPCITVSNTAINCANLGSATVTALYGTGPFSYTWMPSGQTGSVATNLAPGTYTVYVSAIGSNFTYSATTGFVSPIPLTGNVNYAGSVTCNGAGTASANVTNLAGGSGTVNYQWVNGTTTLTSATPSLSAGLWSVTVTDALTFCKISQSFVITQPPPVSILLSANSLTACAANSITLSGLASGGTPNTSGPAYTYSWEPGPATASQTVSQPAAGTYMYTLTATDQNNCKGTNTISTDFIPNPIISVQTVSVCPLQTGVLIASGASTYTWNTNTTGNSFSDNPLSTQQYTVIGDALGCTSTATGSIVVKPVPVPMLNSNSPVCNGQSIHLSGFGANTFFWSGPGSYTSSLQYPDIVSATTNESGVYGMTVTGANGCTASAQTTVVVHPTPTLSATGSTVCINQAVHLTASSFAGATFTWSGPGSFVSSLQNPSVISPAVASSGNYTVKVTSADGCTNSAVANVTVTAMPSPSISSNSPQCFGKTLNLAGAGAGAGSYYWTGPNGFSSGVQNPTISNITPAEGGSYNLQVSLGPCVTSTTHSVTIHPLPAFSLNSNAPVCEDHDLSLGVSSVPNALVYVWKGPGNYTHYTAQAVRPAADTSFTGVYTLSIADANGCQNTATHTVAILKNPVLSPVSATVCLNQPATLKVSGAISYTWTGPSYQSFQPEAYIASASQAVATVYTVTGKAANQCTSAVTAGLSTWPLPQPSLKVSPSNTVCLQKEISMEGSGGMGYEWHGPDNLLYKGKELQLKINSPAYAGDYTLVVSDERGCQSKTITSVAVNGLPGGHLTASRNNNCAPFCSDFVFKASSPGVTGQWQLKENTFSSEHFSGCFVTPGTYTLNGYLEDTVNHCSNTIQFLVEAYEKPRADFEISPASPVEDEQVYLVNTSQGIEQSSWSWSIKNTGTDQLSGERNYYSFSRAGSYAIALVVKNKWGCADSSIQAINVQEDLTIYVPNVFTPNGDDRNDVFLPVIRGLKSYQLRIFDRWGQQIFATNDPLQGWDGTYKGLDCKQDVYVWKIDYSALNGSMKSISGHVLLEK